MGARYKLDIRFESDDEETSIEVSNLFTKLSAYMVDNVIMELTRWDSETPETGKWVYVNVG